MDIATQRGKGMNERWFTGFFQGLTLDVWKEAMTAETTADEAAFVANNLGVQEGDSLLDVPCGNGRLSLMLADMGFRVNGIDTSQEWIDEARENAKSANLDKIDFSVGDMRDLPWNEEFDGALCMGNSFGFFDKGATAKFLASVQKALKPGARFIIDSLMVAETFLTNAGQREWQRLGDIYMLVENIFDCRRSVVESTYTYIDSKRSLHQTSTAYYHVFTCGQVCSMLDEAGFEVLDLFSSVDEEPYDVGSPRLLLVARRN
jgi:2-polyprenyl-3-methyl-5-hydroxy-6-metoxy-1,4-benzoquinol methylase